MLLDRKDFLVCELFLRFILDIRQPDDNWQTDEAEGYNSRRDTNQVATLFYEPGFLENEGSVGIRLLLLP